MLLMVTWEGYDLARALLAGVAGCFVLDRTGGKTLLAETEAQLNGFITDYF